MTVSQIMRKMIEFSGRNLHDINHFIKVWGYAKTIGELEELDERTQKTLEIAAITHDIACPLCRVKYGNTEGKNQEKEGGLLVREFLSDAALDADIVERVAFLVAHHHTLEGIEGADYQILIEADFIVNADEMNASKEQIAKFCEKNFRTASGRALLRANYDF